MAIKHCKFLFVMPKIVFTILSLVTMSMHLCSKYKLIPPCCMETYLARAAVRVTDL